MLKDYLLMLSSICLIEKAYPQCSGTTETIHVGYTTESISPPGYQSSGYGKNLSCSWIGMSSVGKAILLRVTDITLSCAGDSINVFDGISTNKTAIHINECMSGSSPRTLGYKVASSQNVYITFTSDSITSSSELGFKMYMISGDDFSGTGCSSPQILTATPTEQFLSSPSFPNQYPVDKICTWIIKTNNNDSNIYIEIKFMSIEADSVCQYDYLEILDTGNTSAKLCDEDYWNPTYNFTSADYSNFMITFVSDDVQPKQGFLLSYKEKVNTVTYSSASTTEEFTTVYNKRTDLSNTVFYSSASPKENTVHETRTNSNIGVLIGSVVAVLFFVLLVVISVVCKIRKIWCFQEKSTKKYEDTTFATRDYEVPYSQTDSNQSV